MKRYFRNGESEYYINKTLCRLKDIYEMFVDTGMSSGAYSVIELNMVESILSKNPTDRRMMIDEAAGINNYNKRKAATTRKLIATKSDMERVNDILIEVEANVKKLKLQMKRYERHRVLSDELVNSQYLYSSKMLDLIDGDLKPVELSLEKKSKSKKISDNQLSKREEELKTNQAKFEKTKIKLESVQKQIKTIEDDIVSTNQKLIISTEQIASSKNRIEHFNKEIYVKNEQKLKVDSDIKLLHSEIKTLQPNIKKKSTEHQKLITNHEKWNNQLLDNENKRNSIQKSIQDKLYKINSCNNTIDTNKKLISENEIVISEYKKDLKANESDHSEIKKLLEKKTNSLDRATKVNKKNISALDTHTSDINKLELELINLIKNKNDLSGKILSHRSQIDFYNNIILTDNGKVSGNDYLMKNKTRYKMVLGRVSDLVKSDSRHISALSISLGDLSDYVVIDKMKNALDIIEKYKNKKMSFNFIVLDKIKKTKKINISSKHLISNIEFDKEYHDLFSVLIGRYCMANDISDVKNENLIYVTPNGDILTKTGRIQINPNIKKSTFFTSNEIDRLNADIKKIYSDISKVEIDIKKITTKKEKLDKKINSLNDVHKDHEESIKQDIIYIEQKKFALNEYFNRMRNIKINISSHEKNIVNLKMDINKSKLNLKEHERNMSKGKKDIEDVSKSIQQLKNNLLDLRQSIQQKHIGLIDVRNKRDMFESRIKDYTENSNELKKDIDRYSLEIKKLSKLIKQLQESINKSNTLLKKLYLNEKNLNKEKNTLEISYSRNYQKFQTIQVDISEKRHSKDLNTEEINKIKLDIERMKGEKDFYKKKINEINKNLINNHTLEKFDNMSPDEIQKKIDKTKNSIERIGPVNMDVDTQHKEEIERFDFLSGQYNDLTESEKSLKETISQLDKEARKRFEVTFEKIKSNFSKTYNLFYDKGHAKIELKGDDVLDAEIIIKATPPGKSTQSLSMLSGGEKAITAISLLFAIYLVKPSPFCILDEVDAPLDDKNIIKFNNVIRKFSKNSQFIIVTHNKLTMEASDYLYGVTQQKQGVSSIVSVNLKDLENVQEQES